MKKTLSMILALLIIACSMSAVITSYAENSTNLLANKKAADWTGYQWSKISDSEVSKDGGNGLLVESAMHQSIYTTVTLKPNTAYDFSFNWKSVENDKGPAFPSVIQVYSASEVDIEDRATNWKDGGTFNPKTGTDLEKGSNYTNEDNAKTYKWQNLSTGFVTGNGTEYHLIIRFGIVGSNNKQAINLSDFVLEEVGSADDGEDPDELIYDGGLDKTTDLAHQSSYDNATYDNWHVWYRPKSGGWNTEIQDDGTNKVLSLNSSWVYQSVNITANTTYILRFKAKNASADLRVEAYLRNLADTNATLLTKKSEIIPAGQGWTEYTIELEVGALLEGVTDYTLGLYCYNKSVLIDDISFKEKKYTVTATAEEGGTATVSNNSVKPGETVTFTATPETNYEFDGWYSGETKVSGELEYQVTVSDNISLTAKFIYVALDELLYDGGLDETTTLAHQSSYDNATYDNWHKWYRPKTGGWNTEIQEDGTNKVLFLNSSWVYQSVNITANTTYILRFKAKNASADLRVEAYLRNLADTNATLLTKKSEIIPAGQGWTEYTIELEVGALLEGVTDYTLGLYCYNKSVLIDDISLTAKFIYVDPDDDDTVVDEGNLAANFSAASGNVTWTNNAKNITFSDRVSDLEGGLSWGFGMSKTLFEAGYTNTGEWLEPAYVNIKTDELKAEHKYEFSYIFQKDYLIVFDSIDADAEIIKTEDVKLLNGDRAHRITVRFLAKNSGVHNIKLKMGKGKNNENCRWNYVILSDLKLYDTTNRVYGSIKSELGGTVSGFDNSYCLKGDNVTLIATPLSSNTFEGWFDTEGNLVSTNAKFEFVAENDFEYTACFLGGNLPNTEWLAEHGMDGTFENGGMDGWKAEDRNDGESSAWAKFERSTDIAYNGDYSLRFYARYRTSFFTFNNLKKSTNYLLTFYVNDRAVFDPREDESDLDYNEEARINWFSITSGATTLYEDFGTSDAPSMKGGSGWYKVSIPFNTGDFTNVDWNLYYTNKDKQPDNYIYMDDISLVEYTVDNFSNGDFEDSSSVPWRGNFTIENGAGKGNNLYQNANLQAQSSYTVTFKAKGNGVAGASVITTKPFDCTNYISSDSSVNINSTEWKTYSFNVFTGVYPHAAIFFKANEGDILVDDVTLTKNLDRGNSIVEKIDFETDRFALHTNSNVFEIYNGTIGDANVYSGTKSLKFNSANAQKGVAYLLEDAFVSVQLGAKINYKLTIYYKTTKGNSIYLAPNYLPDDGVKTVYTAANNGWTKVEFTFNRRKLSYAKVMIGNVLGKTNADFYIDDITLTVMPPMVLETNSKNKYCEYPLNVLNNQGFEDKITNADWINLPKTAEVRTDKAFAGKKYLRINASTYYVLPVNIEANESYYFSISSRLGGNSSGYVAVATNPEGTNLYNDVNGRIASKIVVDTEKWNRDSFLFSTSESGIVYLVFAVQKGYIDIDEVHLYKQQYGKETDPNNHTFVPFDFKNLDPDLAVLNGGKPHDTNYDDSQDGSGATDEYGSSPQTGDNRTAPAIVLIVSTIAAMVLMFSTKRTREKFKGGKA